MPENKKSNFLNKPWYLRGWGIIVSVFLLFFLVWLIGLNMWLFNPTPKNSNQYINPLTTDIDDDPSWGNIGARITIIAFEDFTCSACEEAYSPLRQLRENYWDKVFFVFRDFPIIGPDSMVAALASECADDQDKFWEMHDKLYENQQLISPEYVRAFAAQIGLDMISFNDCYDSGKHNNEIKNDFNEGMAAGASATPTWFINGNKFEGAFPYELWQEIIDNYK